MRRSRALGRRAVLHLLRGLALAFLVSQAALQLEQIVTLPCQLAAVLVGLLAAVALERARLRFLPALLAAIALPVVLRAALLAVVRLEALISPGPQADLLPFFIDRELVPGLLPYAFAWLSTFLILRRPGAAAIEVGINGCLLVGVLWSQAHYRLTLYPHPVLFAACLAGYLLVETGVLLASRSLEGEREGAPRATGSAAGAPPAAPRRRSSLRRLAAFAAVVLPVLAGVLLLLLARWREGAVAAGGGLMKPTLFRFDFSPYIRLETEISTSDEPVLLMRVEGEADRWLLRRFVLSGYDARRGFFVDRGRDTLDHPAVVPDEPLELPDPGWTGREAVEQDYFFLSIDPTSLVAVNQPRRVAPLQNWKSSPFLRVYRVSSSALRSRGSLEAVRSPPRPPKGLAEYYTRASADQRIAALAEEVTSGADGYGERVLAIERWLKTGFLYSLKPGAAADGDQLGRFLFDTRRGYCSYFAFAMALMCRSLGIPARVAVGFLVPRETEVLNFYEVRAFQAHAWVEVWFGERGWVEFDPTSATLAPGEQFTPFPGPDLDRLAALIRQVIEHQDELVETRPRPADGRSALAGAASAAVRLLSGAARLWYLLLPGLALLAIAVGKLGRAATLLVSRDPRQRARGRWRLTVVRLGGVRISRRGDETPLEFARRARSSRGIELPPLAEAYLAAAFAPRFGWDELAALRSAERVFLASFRERMSWAARLAGSLNPVRSRP